MKIGHWIQYMDPIFTGCSLTQIINTPTKTAEQNETETTTTNKWTPLFDSNFVQSNSITFWWLKIYENAIKMLTHKNDFRSFSVSVRLVLSVIITHPKGKIDILWSESMNIWKLINNSINKIGTIIWTMLDFGWMN